MSADPEGRRVAVATGGATRVGEGAHIDVPAVAVDRVTVTA